MSHQNPIQAENTAAHLNGQLKTRVPEPEVLLVTAERRRFSQSYKMKIVAEAEACQSSGEIGSLLRREGLYSSHLSRWRQARDRGEFEGGAAAKRGRKSEGEALEIARLQKENEGLKQALEQAHLVLDIPKKVSHLLGLKLTLRDESR